jgi:hypothetical protein
MRTLTPIAKLGLAGILGLSGWLLSPTSTALAHDRDHRDHDRGHDHGYDHGRAYQGHEGHGAWTQGGWRRPAIEVNVRPAWHPTVQPRRIWVPGYWGYRARHRIWIEGAWAMPPQENMIWVAPQWVWDEGSGQWVWAEGHWAAAGY